MKNGGKAIALVGINLLLTLGLIEAALRLFPTVIPVNLLIHFEPKLRSQLAAGRFPTAADAVAFDRTDGGFPFPIWKPFAEINYSFTDPGTVNTVKMDELGFCNVPELYSQTPNFDVMGIGDSFTWCTTVRPEDTWVAQLADTANTSTYNLGKPAIGLYEYLQLLERFGLEKSPKVVVLNIYEGNDLRDALKYQNYRATGNVEADGSSLSDSDTQPSAGFLRRHSYTWNVIQAAIAKPPTDPQAATTGRSADGENFRYDLEFDAGTVPFNLENGDLDEVVHAKLLNDGDISLEVFTGALEKFAALAQAEGFTPILTYTPSAYTAYAEVVKFEQPELTDIMPAYSQRQRDFFAEKAAELGIELIDLTPILQAQASDFAQPEKLLYYQTNRHYTRFGHRVVAEAISEAVSNALQQPNN